MIGEEIRDDHQDNQSLRDAMREAMTTMSFSPDWVSPPGDTIADLLDERGWTQTEFADRLGTSRKFVSQLMSGEASIDEGTALKLKQVLGGTSRFWLNRESAYRAGVRGVSGLPASV